MSKQLLINLFALAFTSNPAIAKKVGPGGSSSHSVKGHVKKDGTYVQPHRAANQNHTQRDNWSSKPNSNPYTSKPGTKEAEK